MYRPATAGARKVESKQRVAFIARQRFEVDLNGLLDIGHRIFERGALGLTPLQFRTPRVETVFVFFDDNSCLASHGTSLAPVRCPQGSALTGTDPANSEPDSLVLSTSGVVCVAFVNLIWPLLILSFGPTWPLWRLPVQTPLFDPLP